MTGWRSAAVGWRTDVGALVLVLLLVCCGTMGVWLAYHVWQAACEWAPDNIRVNAVAPWYIATPLAEQVLQHEEYKQRVLDRCVTQPASPSPHVYAT